MKALLRAYGSFLLMPMGLPSLLVTLASLCDPVAGSVALLAGLLAWLTRRSLPWGAGSPALELINALLTGHLLGSSYGWQPLVLLAGPLAVLTTQLLIPYLRRPLCAPFVLSGWGLLALGQVLRLPTLGPAPTPSWECLGLCSLGGIYLSPTPLAGGLVLLALALTSRRLCAQAALYFLYSWGLLMTLGVPLDSPAQALAGTQAVLAGLMVGGLWLSPGLPALVLGLVSACLASLLYLMLVQWLAPLAMMPLALPFLLATWTALALFLPQGRGFWRFQQLAHPALPEHSAERLTLAQARGLDPHSVALRPPFRGAWQVYQGFDGPHTHQGRLACSLDFIQMRGERAFAHQGLQLEDFFCFGQTVLSPLDGVVVEAWGERVDNALGEVDTEFPWGNYVMIQAPSGVVAVLAHLQQGSLQVVVGQSLTAGQEVARCGNSGRSPQPHLHLHLQAGPGWRAPSIPFHLSHLICRGEYRLDCRPLEGDSLEVPEHQTLLHFPVGRKLTFQVDCKELRSVTVELDPLGQFWLVSDRGARVAFHQNGQLLAFFERCSTPDRWLDSLVLAIGLTPQVSAEVGWEDRPPSRLLGGWRFSANLRSHYQRKWDEQQRCWIQTGRHGRVASQALLDPNLGLREFALEGGVRSRVQEVGLLRDQGIPGWQLVLAV